MGAHWYIRGDDGAVRRYYQYKANGEPRATIDTQKALADGAVRSVTTICRLIGDSEWLVQWAVSKACSAALEYAIPKARDVPAMIGDDETEFRRALSGEAIQVGNSELVKAADRGTEIHDAINKWFTCGTPPPDAVAAEAVRAVTEFLEARNILYTFGEHCLLGEIDGYRYGGTADLIAERAVVDWKTVSELGRKPKISEAAQLVALHHAAVQSGLSKPDAELINVFISRDSGRVVGFTVWGDRSREVAMDFFKCALRAMAILDQWRGAEV